MNGRFELDDLINAWVKSQDQPRVFFKASNVPQSLRDRIVLVMGAMPTPKMIAASLRRCGFTKFNANIGGRNRIIEWLSPPIETREGLLMSVRGVTCPKCKEITIANRPDRYRFHCIECGHAETAEQSLARLRAEDEQSL